MVFDDDKESSASLDWLFESLIPPIRVNSCLQRLIKLAFSTVSKE